MIKSKPCQGTSKAINYGCGKLVDVNFRKYGLGVKCCYADWLYSSEEGKAMIEKATLKATKPRKEMETAVREDIQRKRLPVVLKQTQTVFNEYIRLRDKHQPCISSGFPLNGLYDAGHLFSVKQYSGLRFDERNVHAQSIGDNRYNEGNFEDYLVKIYLRVDADLVDQLVKDAQHFKIHPKKWTIEEVLEIKKEYQIKLKKLKQ